MPDCPLKKSRFVRHRDGSGHGHQFATAVWPGRAVAKTKLKDVVVRVQIVGDSWVTVVADDPALVTRVKFLREQLVLAVVHRVQVEVRGLGEVRRVGVDERPVAVSRGALVEQV